MDGKPSLRESAMQQEKGRDLMPVWFSLGHLANDWAPCTIWLIAPAIALSMDLTPAEVGLLVTIHSLGAAVGYPPAGILTDRVSNHGRLLLATFWWVAVGYLLASLATDFWTIALLLALAGMGDAAWHPIATGVLLQRAPATRARMRSRVAKPCGTHGSASRRSCGPDG